MKSSNEEILLVFGKENGKDAWYFVSVTKLKKPIFDRMMKTKNYDLNSVGRILEKGWGKEPPEANRKKWLE